MLQADRRDDDAVAAGGVPEAGPGHAARRRQAHQGGVKEAAEAVQKGGAIQNYTFGGKFQFETCCPFQNQKKCAVQEQYDKVFNRDDEWARRLYTLALRCSEQGRIE